MAKNNYKGSKNSKFMWEDGDGRKLTAGGLVPYNDKGIWLVAERGKKMEHVVWTDVGGRYMFEDCDIYKTIAREAGEELYHSSELLRQHVIQISKNNKPIYVNGHRGLPVYIAYPVTTEELEKYGFVLDPRQFHKNRIQALKSNPYVPREYYVTIQLKFFTWNDIFGEFSKKPRLSYRIKRILKDPLFQVYAERCKPRILSKNDPVEEIIPQFEKLWS